MNNKFYCHFLLGIATSLVVPTLVTIPAVQAEENTANSEILADLKESLALSNYLYFSANQDQTLEYFKQENPGRIDVSEIKISPATVNELTANSTQAQDLTGTEIQRLPNTQNQPVFLSQGIKQTIIPDRGFYISITPGVMFGYSFETVSPTLFPSKYKTDAGFSVSGALGYKLRDIRIEGEFTYARNNASEIEFNDGNSLRIGGYFQTLAYMLNAYYDIPLTPRFRPYIGGGLGAATFSAEDIVQVNRPTFSGSNTAFSFQFKAGIGYQVTDNLNVFIGYRLLGISGQDFQSGVDRLEGRSFTTNSFQFGGRILF